MSYLREVRRRVKKKRKSPPSERKRRCHKLLLPSLARVPSVDLYVPASHRVRRAISRLRITSINELLAIERGVVVRLGGFGEKTWKDIAKLQERIREQQRKLAECEWCRTVILKRRGIKCYDTFFGKEYVVCSYRCWEALFFYDADLSKPIACCRWCGKLIQASKALLCYNKPFNEHYFVCSYRCRQFIFSCNPKYRSVDRLRSRTVSEDADE